MPIRTVNGLLILDIPVTAHGISFHSFYLKEHNENKSHGSISKTLFVGNVDFKENMSLDEISRLLTDIFEVFGSIESISVSDFTNDENSIKNSRFAHVVFKSKSSLKTIFSPLSQNVFVEIKNNIAVKYSTAQKLINCNPINSKYCYDFNDSKKLSEEASAYIHDYEENEMLEISKRNKESEVDEDGFTQVKYRFVLLRSNATICFN